MRNFNMTKSNTLLEKTVTLTLASASFTVKGKNDEELLENAKKAMAEQLAKGEFPHITYGIYEANALTLDKVFAGQIVEDKDGLGIITGVNKKTISVTYANHVSVDASPQHFTSSDATFEQARSKRSEMDKQIKYWTEGHSGYIKTADDIHEIVVGKTTRGKVKLHIVGTKRFFPLSEEEMVRHLKDEKSELA